MLKYTVVSIVCSIEAIVHLFGIDGLHSYDFFVAAKASECRTHRCLGHILGWLFIHFVKLFSGLRRASQDIERTVEVLFSLPIHWCLLIRQSRLSSHCGTVIHIDDSGRICILSLISLQLPSELLIVQDLLLCLDDADRLYIHLRIWHEDFVCSCASVVRDMRQWLRLGLEVAIYLCRKDSSVMSSRILIRKHRRLEVNVIIQVGSLGGGPLAGLLNVGRRREAKEILARGIHQHRERVRSFEDDAGELSLLKSETSRICLPDETAVGGPIALSQRLADPTSVVVIEALDPLVEWLVRLPVTEDESRKMVGHQ